jgi:hypothetical protein
MREQHRHAAAARPVEASVTRLNGRVNHEVVRTIGLGYGWVGDTPHSGKGHGVCAMLDAGRVVEASPQSPYHRASACALLSSLVPGLQMVIYPSLQVIRLR